MVPLICRMIGRSGGEPVRRGGPHCEGPWMPHEGGNVQIRRRMAGGRKPRAVESEKGTVQKCRQKWYRMELPDCCSGRGSEGGMGLEEWIILEQIPFVCQTWAGLIRIRPRSCHLGQIYYTGWLIKLYWFHFVLQQEIPLLGEMSNLMCLRAMSNRPA